LSIVELLVMRAPMPIMVLTTVRSIVLPAVQAVVRIIMQLVVRAEMGARMPIVVDAGMPAIARIGWARIIWARIIIALLNVVARHNVRRGDSAAEQKSRSPWWPDCFPPRRMPVARIRL
jgi:hypothetical protein